MAQAAQAKKARKTKAETLLMKGNPLMTRVMVLLPKIAQLSKYGPTETQKAKILDALKGQVKLIEDSFATTVARPQASFQLNS